jgi:hypothetical protein
MQWESYDASGRHHDLMRLQSYFLQAQKILHSTGAFLRQFLVDDKGCVLIACWGMPSLSYLDNPHRALSAAAQIRAKLMKMEMKCSFGITTGDVYCGTVGSALRMEYAAIGSVVNMSARLMGKAHEGILLDHETYSSLPDTVTPSLEKLPPITVKGRDEPIQVYRYSGEGSILIGDDVVEDHEVREVCKVTFLKLLDNMKAPGRFSVFRRRQSVAKVKEWLNESVKRGGDLLTNSTKDTSASSRNSLLRSSFRDSFRMSFKSPQDGGSTRSSRSAILAPGGGLSTKSGDGQSARLSGASGSLSVRRGSMSQSVGPRGQYQHDDGVYRHIHEIPYVLMEGRRGAGKSSIVNWLKKQASDRSIPVYRARISRDDMMVDYSVWLKVFKQHMPKDMYRSEENQSKYLTPLLNTVYPDDPDTIEHVVMPALRRALNITCEVELFKDDSSFGGDLIKPTPKNKAKVTSRVVTETLLKIFAHLLNEKPELIIIENIQFADEESLNVLLGLTHLHTLSAVVLTGLGPDSLSGKKVGTPLGGSAHGQGIQRIDSFDSDFATNDDGMRNEWYAKFRASVLFYDHATLITLDDFTPYEIDKMLCDALNLIQVPHEISQLVQDLSGGSFFWVKEIMHFLQEHGREEFLHAISVAEEDGGHGHRRSGTGNMLPSVTSPRESFAGGMRFLSQAVNFTRKSLIRRISLTAPDPHQATKKVTKFKLELLVVCRFEKLTVEVQHVLRTASIIGVHFSTSLLYGVLPTYLQNDMQPYVDALLRQKWIHQDAEDPCMYQFTHPYAHKIIYDLTPSSERNNMHQIIADYIEHTSFNDPTHYALLSSHNTHCNVEKAFHYTFKAVTHLLENGTSYEIGQCVDLMYDALPLLVTVVDADVLQIMVYNVRKKIDALGEDTSSVKMSTRAANAIVGGLFGAVNALGYRWKGKNKQLAVSSLAIIDEGISTKSGKSSRSVASMRYEAVTGANIGMFYRSVVLWLSTRGLVHFKVHAIARCGMCLRWVFIDVHAWHCLTPLLPVVPCRRWSPGRH